MFKKLYHFFNQIDFSELNNFQKTVVYITYSGGIRKI